MKGTVLGNRYEIIEKIGGGGMAIVYKAECKLLNRYVAIKVLRDEFINDEEFIKKFRRESQAAASLSHPNIVNIYDVGEEKVEDKAVYYIVMEYIKGKTLKEIVKETRSMPVGDIISYSMQIADALEAAHRNHIIHRDIKPHNIMVTEDGRVKVTDFGIARAATTSTVTNTSNVIGSVHYFSPEQARGGYVDERSDIYSLGIVMYEMATGRIPFEGDTPVSVALKHIQEDIEGPKNINPNIPEDLNKIILKATRRSPDDRYQTVSDLKKDLKKLERKEEVLVEDEPEEDDGKTRVIPIVSSKPKEILADNMDSTAEIDLPKNFETNGNKDKKPKKQGGAKVIFLAILLAFVTTGVFGFGFLKLKDTFSTKEIEVPALVGLDEKEAELLLKDKGLNMKITDRLSSSEFKEGQVMSQDIKEGEKVKEGYTIDVEVSKGKDFVKVPNLINRDVKDLEDILDEYGLKSGAVKYEYNENIQNGLIISQNPDAYSEVEEGSDISVVVSKGKENKLVEVPNLVGLKENDAKNLINTKGLSLSDRSEKHSSEYPKGSVIWQSINPGREVEKNTSISIAVSLGEEEKVDPEPSTNGKEIPFNLNLSIPDTEEDVEVAIVRYQKDQKETVYTGKISKDQTAVVISLTGTSDSKFEVYFNGNYHETISHPGN